MTSIVTRTGKGAPLTISELDANFTNLNTDKVEKTRIVGAAAGELTVTNGGALNNDIELGLPNTGITAGTINNSATQLTPVALDAKGRVVGVSAPVTIAPQFSSLTNVPSTLAGYGITDAQTTVVGGATTITDDDLTASRALVSDVNGKVAASGVSATELGYLQGLGQNAQSQLDGKQSTAEKNQANGYAGLNASGKLSDAVIPDLAISEYLGAVANETEMLALTGQKGDWCTRDDAGTIFVITGNPATVGGWMQMAYPGTPVKSVAGKTGIVTLDKTDVGLSALTNDAQLKIASNLADLNNAATARTNLGLGNVDNTSDATKNSATATLTNKTLTLPKINDTSSDHTYNLAVSELTANRTVTLPLLTTNDEFVFADHTKELKNKTISGSNNTLSNIGNSSLTNSSITFGSTAHALGSTVSALNGVSIGGTTPAAGAFTTLSSTGNTTLGGASTDTVTVNGYMGVGGAARSDIGLNCVSAGLTGTSQAAANFQPTANSSATSETIGVYARGNTAAAAFTVANSIAYYALNASRGAGSTITNLHGVYIADQTQGTNNYGITSLVSSGTNKWNIYASGTAANYFAGNVGIGTSSPFAAYSGATPGLEIYGAGAGITTPINLVNANTVSGIRGSFLNYQIHNGTSVVTAAQIWGYKINNTSGGTLGFYTAPSDWSSPMERLRIDSTGNLGLGVTPSGWDSGGNLTLKSGGTIFSNTGSLVIGSNAYYNAGWKYAANGYASNFNQGNGAFSWQTASNNTSGAGASLTFTTAMTLDASGQLMLGTTTASTYANTGKVLTVSGSASNTAPANLYLQGNASTPGRGFNSTEVFSISGVSSANEITRITGTGSNGFRAYIKIIVSGHTSGIGNGINIKEFYWDGGTAAPVQISTYTDGQVQPITFNYSTNNVLIIYVASANGTNELKGVMKVEWMFPNDFGGNSWVIS